MAREDEAPAAPAGLDHAPPEAERPGPQPHARASGSSPGKTANLLAAKAVLAGIAAVLRLSTSRRPRDPADAAGREVRESAPAPETVIEDGDALLGSAVTEAGREVLPASVAEVPRLPASEAATAPLLVSAVSASTHTALARVRLTIFPEGPAVESASTHVQGLRGSWSESPVTDADGRAEFEVPAGMDLVLWVLGEEAGTECGPRDVPALRQGERREMTLAPGAEYPQAFQVVAGAAWFAHAWAIPSDSIRMGILPCAPLPAVRELRVR